MTAHWLNCNISICCVMRKIFSCVFYCSFFNSPYFSVWSGFLTHWGRVMQICVSKLTIIGSDNGLSTGRRQAIIWTNAGILSIRTLGTYFSEILGKIHSFSFKKMHLKMSSAKGRLFSLGLNELRHGIFQCTVLCNLAWGPMLSHWPRGMWQ